MDELNNRKRLRQFLNIEEIPDADEIYRFLSEFHPDKFTEMALKILNSICGGRSRGKTIIIDSTDVCVDINWFRNTYKKSDLENRDFKWAFSSSKGHAGRILHMMGNFHSGCIMLGYIVETIMKAGLIEVLSEEQQHENRTLKGSHDVRNIFNECRKHGIFDDIRVSRDFLDHINNFQRYPSQMEKIWEDSHKQNTVLGNSVDWEAIQQIDSSCQNGKSQMDTLKLLFRRLG